MRRVGSYCNRGIFDFQRILFVVNGTFQLNSVDIILQDSRKSDKMEGYLKTINGLSAKNLDEVPEDGIWISVHQTCFVISCEEGKLEVHTDLSRIQKCDHALDGFTSGDISPSTIATETSNLHSLGLNQALGFASINLEPASSHWACPRDTKYISAVRWALFEAFTMGISQISIVLVAEDESVNMRKKFMLDLSSLSILSQILCGSVKNEIQIPHFASGISNDLLSHSLPGDPTIAFQRKDGTHPVPDGASSSSDPVSKKEALMHNSVSEGFQLSCQRYILKRLRAFILVQKSMPETENVPLRLYPVWVGNGSVSGFDMIISLSEIQMILSAVASFSEISTKETIDNLKQEHQSSSQGLTIVWKEQFLMGNRCDWNCRPGSGFVDISSTNDSEWALWRTVSYKPESYEGDADWGALQSTDQKHFYLINKKNDCAVAFVDGIPEFVRKPGNPFKLKVFHDSSLACDVAVLDNHSTETSGSNLQHNPCVDKERTFMQTEDVPCIDVTIDEVSLTIVHELSDTDDKVPLLRGCKDICGENLFTQLRYAFSTALVFKLRVQKCFPECSYAFYFRCKEVEISLTEVSLDILLFVIGKLNLAGPFSVKTSMILAHCCKVENQSGLNLLFRYQDDQGLSIARKQSASIFLRYLHSDYVNYFFSCITSKVVII
ncbi:hypothetical protein CK203_111286 [Vitis vinifera]|uniref:Vacuolar protein sorting-associated protein 13 VPS13 adaptor binding domain-containing protein n=1 Tax=Vitis vinifera TaxID=29760 RepID=A0A438FBC0_VITVI|nr:hypothetical protein CK203_111286 [Vitis vinifera]